jgi:tetratricopeptide (TPR) repeat protein
MKAKILNEWMKIPAAHNDEALAGLRSVLRQFPYFQAARYLYALHLLAAGDSRFNAELRKTACYAGDRRKLFYAVQSATFPPEWMARMEKKSGASNASFDLIDSFLSAQPMADTIPSPLVVPSAEAPVPYRLPDAPDEADSQAVPLQHQDIIDRFLDRSEQAPIKLTPRPVEREKVAAPTASAAPAEPANSFLSETLVKIYIKQKKYEKALEIIRKLYLLYPEKNLYFADQIRYLETLIHNIKK